MPSRDQDSVIQASYPGLGPEALTARGLGVLEEEPSLDKEVGSGVGLAGLPLGSSTCISLLTQASYLKQKGLGGAMVWALDMDDFAGFFCNQGPYPLIRALQLELSESGARDQRWNSRVGYEHSPP